MTEGKRKIINNALKSKKFTFFYLVQTCQCNHHILKVSGVASLECLLYICVLVACPVHEVKVFSTRRRRANAIDIVV